MASFDTRALANALGGEVAGPGQVLCPGPGHSPKDRSLSVRFDDHATQGFTVHSFASDHWRDCRDLVCAKLHLPKWDPASCSARPQRALPHIKPVAKESTALALHVYSKARPLHGTLGETYLTGRVGNALEWPHDLRFHPACVRMIGGRVERHPTLIALLREIYTNEPRAIQRTFLLPDGSDRLRDAAGKMTLGPTRGSCIKLTPDDEVTLGLGICEGLETGLRLLSLGWRPIWIMAGTAGMAAFPVLRGIESLKVFADHDANRAGESAALKCISRWSSAGRDATATKPRTKGRDWNDV